jgi:hypothetical protein
MVIDSLAKVLCALTGWQREMLSGKVTPFKRVLLETRNISIWMRMFLNH